MIKFQKINHITAEIYEQLYQELEELKPGKYELIIRKPKRTPAQNRLIHAFFNDLALALDQCNVDLCFGKFKASWTEVTAKIFFKEIYLGGKKTSKSTTKEISEALDKCVYDLNKLGANLSIQSKDFESLCENEKNYFP